ncbi:MAG: hypothetical protein RQ756_08060 [Flavobacteriaceae bacterium]|nr:hypothetical protein [Flavobacteriaceae bacterium]
MKNKDVQRARALTTRKNKLGREVIEARDVEVMLDKHKRTAYRVLAKVRKALGKTKDQVITIKEYCEYYGYDYVDIYTKINKFPPFEYRIPNVEF